MTRFDIMKLASALGMLVLVAAQGAVAQAPSLAWNAVSDTGATNSDSTRVIRRMNNGDLTAATQVAPGAVTTIRVIRHNGSTSAVMWTTDISPIDTSNETNYRVIDPAGGDAYLASRIAGRRLPGLRIAMGLVRIPSVSA